MEQAFPDYYTLADEIGRGTFYVNKRCIDLRDSTEYATKVIDLKKLAKIGIPTEQDVIEEIRICQMLKNEHIIEVFHASKVNDTIYVVSELITGVDLCYEIINKVNQGYVYSEVVASHYMRQVFEGLAYIHDNGIVHRDMKPHNIVIASSNESAPIKISEFGIAIQLPECGFVRSGRIGTPHFMAPEVVKREPYDCKVDVWGCGVMLFILLGGTFPFGGGGQQPFEMVEKGDYRQKMSTQVWSLISDAAKELVEQLLEVDPEFRLSAHEALRHPWLSDRDQYAEKLHLEESVIALKQFNARRKLKGAVLATMASRKLTNGLLSNLKAQQRLKMMDSLDVYDEASEKMGEREDALECFDMVKRMISDLADDDGVSDENLTFLKCWMENDKLRSLMSKSAKSNRRDM